ncbi:MULTISPECIES: M48 family metalloprotease [Thalassolituus]|uniref:M48 family metalloprotease n=1 Tax=Thalassolituus TaxID=187492 RepID=UPI000C5FB7DA|nr:MULTISPECIES: M48 family metalloprotease [Thalassolituus]MAX86659.1 peptidase M48 Ste24p [Oceanospirillaceae bacterium]MED5440135.1 M48 family metalloprotease [Pseudomonadota bacterium]MEE3210745.1 M48 family metalloprotease [Pseudomonadota bacterium]HCG77743.1 peptidase M48 Ste24p [Oceanospirillales bacterium]|tara:strand:- start:3186 stop:4013 length:828 start_codon:yes stop_codon:yes gene_type:complete
MKKVISLTLISAAIAGCATTLTGRNQLMIVSPDSAIVESQKAYASTVGELDQNDQLVTDPAWVKRIETITGRLVTEAIKLDPDTKSWDWSVAIIDDPDTLNAWCMAGGRMAIYTGIVTQLNLNDDEIAQIMGHEISHALANHTAERMSRAVLMNGALAATAVVTDNNGYVLTGTAMAAKVALELPNSRTAESEADEIGIELATRAGYNPDAAVSLWKKMAEAGGGGGPEFLSTHPSPDNRASTLDKLGEKMLPLNPQLKKSQVYPVTIVTDADQI